MMQFAQLVLNRKRLVAAGLVFLAVGCYRDAGETPQSAADGPRALVVTTVRPAPRPITRVIEQPAALEAFEETPLIARLPGYVAKMNADIGKRVKEGDVLAELSVPDLVEEHKEQEALVKQALAEIEQAKASEGAATAQVATAESKITEAEAAQGKARASYERWDKQHRVLTELATDKVIDEQSREEALNQKQAAAANVKEVEARVTSAKAARDESKAKLTKAAADVKAAAARTDVARAKEGKLAALLKYAEVRAPFDGIVTRRNIHTGFYLQPGTGAGSQVLFVVARADLLRAVVDVPEVDAGLIKEGMEATLRVQSIKDRDFQGKVARLGYSLDSKARTLRVEIDLPTKDTALLPGMYAYATFNVPLGERLTVPANAVVTQGDNTYLWLAVNGKSVKTQVRLGARDRQFVEVLKKQAGSATAANWVNMTSDDRVIVSNLNSLTDGQAVSVR